MKSFKRCFALALMLLMCLVPLSACHGSKGQAQFSVPEEFDTGRDYEIVFWAKNDTNKTQTQIYQNAIDSFHALYPNITVNLRLYTDYGKIYNDVITNIATRTTPNVCITYPDHIATYLTGDNVVVPLDSFFENGEYSLGNADLPFTAPTKEQIIPSFLEECNFNGHYYALPFMRSTEACYINKTYVEKLGYTLPHKLTWDFVWEVADAATAKDSDGNYLVNGQNVMIPFIYKSTDNMMIQMLSQLNAPYTAENGKVLMFNDTAKELLNTIAEHVRAGAFSTFKISGYPANFLNAGQCIFAVDSTAGSTWMGSHAPLSDISEDKFVDFETVVMPIPQFDPDNPKMISQGPSVCIFNKDDPQEVLASWLFVQYLLSNDVQIPYSQTEGYVPATSLAQNDEKYLDYISRCGEDNNAHYDIKIRSAQLLMDNMDNTFVTPVFNGSASVRDGAGQLIENVTKSVRRKETVDEAYMDKLFEDVTSLYRLDQINTQANPNGKVDLGPMPIQSKILLGTLGGVWLILISYFVISQIKKRKNVEK